MDSQFNQVLEAVDRLSLDEQETLCEILRKRTIERRRQEIKEEIKESESSFASGLAKPVTPEELMKEIYN